MRSTLKVNVKYFASLREVVGKSSEIVEGDLKNIEQLYDLLHSRYKFPVGRKYLKAALNCQYTNFDTPLTEGDTVVLIPPVAGG